MKIFLAVLLLSMSAFSSATVIYTTDSAGRIDYSKPSYETKGNNIYQRDSAGRIDYSKPSYEIKGNNVHRRDSAGRTDYTNGNYKTVPDKKRR